MITDHMELRQAAARRRTVEGHPASRVSLGTVEVSQIALEELLAEFDMLKASSAKTTGYTPEFDAAWSEYPTRPGNSKAAAFKAWAARLKAGATVEQMIEGVRAYAIYVKAERTEPQFIKQAATFFGPGEHYAADWKVSRALEPRRVLPDRRPPVDEQKAAASAEAKRRLMGGQRPPDDDMTFDMVPA